MRIARRARGRRGLTQTLAPTRRQDAIRHRAAEGGKPTGRASCRRDPAAARNIGAAPQRIFKHGAWSAAAMAADTDARDAKPPRRRDARSARGVRDRSNARGRRGLAATAFRRSDRTKAPLDTPDMSRKEVLPPATPNPAPLQEPILRSFEPIAPTKQRFGSSSVCIGTWMFLPIAACRGLMIGGASFASRDHATPKSGLQSSKNQDKTGGARAWREGSRREAGKARSVTVEASTPA